MKIWSLPKHENPTKGKKYCAKRGEMQFPQYFQHISNFKSPITCTFVKCGCSIYFFLKSANLICRSTYISKYFRESLGIRDDVSRLYSQVIKWTCCIRKRVLNVSKIQNFPWKQNFESKWSRLNPSDLFWIRTWFEPAKNALSRLYWLPHSNCHIVWSNPHFLNGIVVHIYTCIYGFFCCFFFCYICLIKPW